MTIIIALSGTGASGDLLSRDIGDLGVPYISIRSTNVRRILQYLNEVTDKGRHPVQLMGYSKGCGIIADISVHKPEYIDRAVLYEGKLGRLNRVGGIFPVCLIWNNNGRQDWNKAIQATNAWKANCRTVLELEGVGGHFKTNPLGHAWDQNLNPTIKKFLLDDY